MPKIQRSFDQIEWREHPQGISGMPSRYIDEQSFVGKIGIWRFSHVLRLKVLSGTQYRASEEEGIFHARVERRYVTDWGVEWRHWQSRLPSEHSDGTFHYHNPEELERVVSELMKFTDAIESRKI